MAESPNEPRLRPHPDERFATPHLELDLNETVARLRGEPKAGEHGRRQETLYRRDGLTIALFVFEKWTELPMHKAEGIVSIQVLHGRIRLTAEDKEYNLSAGQMVVLATGVRHAVLAEEASEMLLTVKLDRA